MIRSGRNKGGLNQYPQYPDARRRSLETAIDTVMPASGCIDETAPLPYKRAQLSDIPPEDSGRPENSGRRPRAELLFANPSGCSRGSFGVISEECREADVSTEQAGAQAPSWLPYPHGHAGRTQGPQCPPGAWTPAPQCVTAPAFWTAGGARGLVPWNG